MSALEETGVRLSRAGGIGVRRVKRQSLKSVCNCGQCKSCVMRRHWANGGFANRRKGVIRRDIMNRLDAAQARLDAATPGPWAWDSRGEKDADVQVGIATNKDGHQLEGFMAGEQEDYVYIQGIAKVWDGNESANAALIAHAPVDLRDLLAVARLVEHATEVLLQCPLCGAGKFDSEATVRHASTCPMVPLLTEADHAR